MIAAAHGRATGPQFPLIHPFRSIRRYELHLERLELPRDAPAEAWLAAYVARLEAHTRSAPWNWFNFYDFWERS